MKMKHSLSFVLSIVFVLSVFLTGCGSQNTPASSTKTSSGSSSSKSTPSVGQPLVIDAGETGAWQDNLNPFSQTALGGTNGLIYQPMYCFSTVSHDSYPFLATAYQWTNGNKTLEVTLRNGVKWSDGQPFTADDVLFTFNTLKKYPAADSNGIMTVVTSITKKSDNVLDFNFASPNVPFQEYVLQQPIVPEHLWKSLGDPTKVVMKNPVGTGPYALESFSPQEYKLKKNESYYDAKDFAVPEIDVPAFDSNESATLSLAKGDIDWSQVFIPNIKKIFVAKDPQHNKYWFPPGAAVMLYPNLKNPLLQDVNVRKAISLAIDRDKIVKQAEYGYAEVTNPTAVLPRDKDFIDPKYANLSTQQDLAGAVKVLQDAGYKKGSDGIFVSPSGKRLSFTLQVVSGWSDWVSTCSIISQNLKKVGIEIKVEQPQYGAYMAALQGGKYDLGISWTNAGATPYKMYQDLLNSHGAWNIEKWNDPQTDAALKELQATTDPAQQKAAMAKLEDVMVNQIPAIPLFYGPVWYIYSTKKYTGWPDASNPFVAPATFSWPAPAVVLSKLRPVSH